MRLAFFVNAGLDEMTISLPWIVMLALALLGRAVSHSWLNPAAFFPACWVVFIGVSIGFSSLFPLHAAGLWVIVSMLVAFQVGGFAIANRQPQSGGSSQALTSRFEEAVTWRLKVGMSVCAALAAFGVLRIVQTGIASFGLAVTRGVVLQLGGAFSAARYSGIEEIPWSVAGLLYFVYPATLMGGMLFAMIRARAWRAASLMPLLLAFLSGFLMAVRLGLLLSTVMWIAGFLAVKVWRSAGGEALFNVPRVLAIGVGGAGLLGAYVWFQWIRGGAEGTFDLLFLVQYAAAAFWGSVAVFTDWIAHGQAGAMAYGGYTFAGPFDFFGLAAREQGLYLTTVYFASGHASNIYTVFRGLIEDFGVVGAWLACVGAGVVSVGSYVRSVAGRFVWTMPLSAFYALALFSNLSSVFVYNSVIMGWVVTAAILVWPYGLLSFHRPTRAPSEVR